MRVFFSAVVLFVLMGINNVIAQPRPGNPGEMAKRQTEWMVKELSLNKDQAAKVEKLNTDFSEKMEKLRLESAGDREAMRSKMQTIRTEQQDELKKILTKEQFETYQKKMEERREARGGERGMRPRP